MEYKVLYRKYRPKNFDEVVGQENTIRILKKSIEDNKLAHAYIFSGIRGTGKTSVAKIFSKAINCLSEDNKPCGKCINCLNFDSSPDIIEIDAASNNGVDEIREIISNSRLMPTNSKYKVYIVDEVHMLSIGAFNALLKTLEEPLEHVVFILATTDIQKVPITILSRCQRFDFQNINQEQMVNHLKNICQKENIKITDDALKEIAFLSDGALRDALSILEQFSKEETKITTELLEKNIGIISNQQIDTLIELVKNKNIYEIVEYIDKIKSKNYDIKIFLKKIIKNLYSRILNKQTFDMKLLDYLEVINKNYFEIDNSFDSYLSFLTYTLDYLSDAPKEIKSSTVNIEENTHIDIKNKIQNKPIDNIKKNTTIPKKEFIRENMSISTGNKYVNLNDIYRIRINNCFVNASKTYLTTAKSIWKNIVNKIESEDLNLYSIVSDSEVVLSSDNYMIILLPTSSELLLINQKYDKLEKYLSDINNAKKVSFVTNDAWKNKKMEYINNLKNNIKYVMQDEPALEKEKSETLAESSALELFGKDNIEII